MQGQALPVHPGLVQPKRNTYLTYSKGQPVVPLLGSNGQQQTLPPGWKREEAMRPAGLGTGKTDVYYISPQGQKIRTKQELKTVLGDKFDLSLFDWRSGKFVTATPKSRSPDDSSEAPLAKIPHLDGVASPLQRRSSLPDVIKPIVIRSHPDCKRADVKNATQESPHQLFWEKRLTGNVAVDPETGEAFKPLSLPRGIQSAGVPGYQCPELVHSLLNAIATKTIPITGQEQPPSAIEKNPCVAVNNLQPMIKTFIVTEDDIRRQELRVKELRRKLEMARKRLHPRYSSEREG